VKGPGEVVISGAVEGLLDEAVLIRLIEDSGAAPGPVYGKMGKNHLQKHLRAYNKAAKFSPWLVLMDLDHDADCAPPFKEVCLPNSARGMIFRIAVRAVETWLLADRERLAKFMNISPSRIPVDPESVDNPKRTMVEMARYSRRSRIREDMVPRTGSGRSVGPAYVSTLVEYVNDDQHGWRPGIAGKSSDSLNRCIIRLRELVSAYKA
jgi:hypothetical protein